MRGVLLGGGLPRSLALPLTGNAHSFRLLFGAAATRSLPTTTVTTRGDSWHLNDDVTQID